MILNKLLNSYNVRLQTIKNTTNNQKIENILNDYPIYVINLKCDTIRRNYIKVLFKRHKINYNLLIVDK